MVDSVVVGDSNNIGSRTVVTARGGVGCSVGSVDAVLGDGTIIDCICGCGGGSSVDFGER